VILLYEIMLDATVIAAPPVVDAKSGGTKTDCLAALIMPLRAIIDAFPVEPPELWDGETWLYFDSAKTGLYGALAALEDLDRMRCVPDQPICAHITV
jgi:hypothetical protein